MIAVVGRANVGKSTLVNSILQEKVSIVSPVSQTTRNVIRGILTEPRGQIVFLDTPGVHKASYDLGRIMNRIARASIEGVDIVLLVVDASVAPRQEDEGWVRRLVREKEPCVVVLNKMDKGAAHADAYRDLWNTVAAEKEAPGPVDWLPASAATGEGVERLVEVLFARVPEGPLLFPEDVLTDFPRKLYMADVIREKLFLRLRDELPHDVAVLIETVEEEDAQWRVSGTVLVARESQKGIVVGEKGRLLRAVRRAAEKELAEVYGQPVSLDLWVKVGKKWNRNYWMLKKLGYAE